MKNNLTLAVYDKLCSISQDDWERLYPVYPDSIEIINLIQDSGLEGFELYSMVIYLDSRPVIHIPLFKTSYNISNFFYGCVQKAVNAVGLIFPKIFRPTLLGIGFVESEWSQIGIDTSISENILDKCWDLALEKLEIFAKDIKASLISFINFNSESINTLPLSKLKDYSSILITPYAVLDLDYTDLEEYMSSLSKKMRKYLARKTRTAKSVRVIKTKDPSEYIEEIYRQYLFVVNKSEIKFSRHSKYFFENICKYSNDAEYLLFFAEGKLLGFKLLIVKNGKLIDKYLGMSQDIALKYNMFFVSWMEVVKYCINKGIKVCLQGPTAENVKRQLECRLIPGFVIFKFRNKIIQECIELLRPFLSYHPEFTGSAAELQKLKAEKIPEISIKGNGKC